MMIVTVVGLNYHEQNTGKKVEPDDILYAVRDTEWEKSVGYHGTSYKVIYSDVFKISFTYYHKVCT